MTWFNPTIGVEDMHPGSVRVGMRIATELHKPLPGGGVQRRTVLTPVWDISTSASGGMSIGRNYLLRLSTGELLHQPGNSSVPVDQSISPENMPPHTGMWITNQPMGFHDHKPGVTADQHFYDGRHVLDEWSVADGRRYELLHHKDFGFWVCRTEGDAKWFGPTRFSSDPAHDQFDAITRGRAW